MRVRFDLSDSEVIIAKRAGYSVYKNRRNSGGRVYVNTQKEALEFIEKMTQAMSN